MAWQVVPPGGWHYNEAGHRIEADGHDSLVRAILDYRTANSLPLRDPAQDLDAYVCGSWPHVCGAVPPRPLEPDAPPLAYGQPVMRKASERVASWAANRYARLGEVHTIEPEEAERRSTVCIACPQNDLGWRQRAVRDCPPCKERIQSLDATLYKVRQGRSVAREKSLGACQASGQDNRTAVWLGSEQLQHARHYASDLDPSCWMRAIITAGCAASPGSGQPSAAPSTASGPTDAGSQ